MHELSVAYALLDQVERIAVARPSHVVTRIAVRIGPLSGVEAALLRRAWPLAAASTIAEQAELVVEEADVIVRCTACDAESVVPPGRLLCSACGDFRTRILSGDDLVLNRVEFYRPQITKTEEIARCERA